MNGPKWRTFDGFKKARAEAVTGSEWDVNCDGDTAIVRVPMLNNKLRDLSFSFRQNDDFLQTLQRLKTDSSRAYRKELMEHISETVLNNLVLETRPHGFKKGSRREDQSKKEAFTTDDLEKLRISTQNLTRAMRIAARAITEHFLNRGRE